MARRRSVDRSARPDPTKAEVALRWKVKILPEGEVQVTDVTTTPATATAEIETAMKSWFERNNIELAPGKYALNFGVHTGIQFLQFPKELDAESRNKIVTTLIPFLADRAVLLSSEFARFPSDDEIREGAEEVVGEIFNHLMRLTGGCGEVPEQVDYSHIRTGCISVVGSSSRLGMYDNHQKNSMLQAVENYLSEVTGMIRFGTGKATFEFAEGKPVVIVDFAMHDVFTQAVNGMLAKRFARILAEVESEVITSMSRDLHKYFAVASGALAQIAEGYGFALEPTAPIEPPPPAEEPIAPVEPVAAAPAQPAPAETPEPSVPVGETASV
jgi:hypothetical protein